MIKTLTKLADRLDKSGLPGYANIVDSVILSLAGVHGEISMLDLMKLMPASKKTLLNAIQFDLEAKPGSIKAVPDIDVDLYKLELDLTKVQDSPKLHQHLTDEGKNALFPDLPIAGGHDFEYIPERKDLTDVDKSLELALKQLKREEFIDPSAQSEEGQNLYQRYQQQLESLEKGRRQKEVNQVVPSALESVEQGDFIQQQYEGRASMQNTEAEVRALLVKMADDFDRSGNHNLASEVDSTLKSFSARPKAPLKKLEDDIKKNLIIFVHDADQSTSKSINGLKELFRRLRYFDLADSIKEIGLDRVVRDMEKTQGCLGGAKSRLYEMMMGRKPSAQALDDFLNVPGDDANEQGALDFFDRHMAKEDVDLKDEEDSEETPEDFYEP